ncbi:MAG: tetratricopeptide repeat protein, partial [Microcystis aeruginosa]
ALCDLHRFVEAIASYDRALEFKTDYYEAWYNQGSALYSLGRLKEAIASYNRASEFKTDYYEA